MASILINVIIGAVIFGYVAMTLFKSVKKQKAGKCAACALQKNCPSNTCETPSKTDSQ